MTQETQQGQFTALGLGPGPNDLMVPRARKALLDADRVYALAREGKSLHKKLLKFVDMDKVYLYQPATLTWGMMINDPVHDDITERISQDVAAGQKVVYVCGGDPSIYSPYAYLRTRLEARGVPIKVIPSISYLNTLIEVDNKELIDESQSLSVAKYTGYNDFEKYLSVSETVVFYEFRKADEGNLKKYIRYLKAIGAEDFLLSASIIVGGLVNKQIDLLTEDMSVNAGTLVLRRGKQSNPVFIPTGGEGHDLTTPPLIKRQTRIYRRPATGPELLLDIHSPVGPGKYPAILLFHGGSWERGQRSQFSALCDRLAANGIVAVTADYQLSGRHNATPFDGVRDAIAAFDWLVANALDLSIDRSRLVIGGGSAGGHIAFFTRYAAALPKGAKIGKSKNAHRIRGLCMLNPVTDTGEGGFGSERIPGDPQVLNVLPYVDETCPPYIVLHGRNDRTVPVANSIDFHTLAQKAGIDGSLHIYEGQAHGFFNPDPVTDNMYFRETTDKILTFIHSVTT